MKTGPFGSRLSNEERFQAVEMMRSLLRTSTKADLGRMLGCGNRIYKIVPEGPDAGNISRRRFEQLQSLVSLANKNKQAEQIPLPMTSEAADVLISAIDGRIDDLEEELHDQQLHFAGNMDSLVRHRNMLRRLKEELG